MNTCCSKQPPPSWAGAVAWPAIGLAIVMALSGCASHRTPPPRLVEVAVPVPVPCEVIKVAKPDRPHVSSSMGLFDLVKTVMADREISKGEIDRLRSANEAACAAPAP